MPRKRLSITSWMGISRPLGGWAARRGNRRDRRGLRALLAEHHASEIDDSYAAYDEHPLDEPDQWGDLASFREAVARS